jgi:hypothetical protein
MYYAAFRLKKVIVFLRDFMASFQLKDERECSIDQWFPNYVVRETLKVVHIQIMGIFQD